MKSYILITGSTSEIGKDICIRLSLKYNLLLFGRNLKQLEELRSILNNKEQHRLFKYDFQDLQGLKSQLQDFLIAEGILIEAAIHCAGIMKVMRMKNVDLENSYHIFNINFFSITEIISVLLKKRINKDSLKNIIFISSILANYGSTGHHLYAATKSALNGLMHSLSIELAPNNIRVNSILPGAVKTKMSEALLSDESYSKKLNQDYPLGIGSPNQISPIVEFLISEKSSWITGQEIIVDGGRTININNK